MSQNRPPRLAHVVYRTRRFDQMLAWYNEMFHARVQHQNPVMAFLTYDDEHHRLAFIDLTVVQPNVEDSENRGLVGVEHSPTPTRHWRTCSRPTHASSPTISCLTGASTTASRSPCITPT